MRIQNNIQALNTMRNYQLSLREKTKSTNKLSSGYRINIAADDAAGLTISEQMREQIRGLNKGTQNAQDGISYIQTGEGALGEVQSILHRMNEITIQSLNDTNTQSDRAALQAEFDELQCEIDNILDNTHFNTKNIFSEHEPTYTQLEGNLTWNQNGVHIIDYSMNKLVINYRKDETSPSKQISIEVPEGEYTTQELVDEIEDALIAGGATEEGFSLEYTDDGTCNLNFEDGKFVDSIAGGLSYLINDVYYGGSVGALIGTTSFMNDEVHMKIASGYNDTLSFDIQSFDGSVTTKSITIPAGEYTRPEMIDLLNNNLAGTSVEAIKYGKGIKLQSNDAIITGFKGNMFKIDTDINNIYSSVFYDNVMYGSATLKEASFTGGAVITTSSKDAQYNHYTIDNSNNELTITANTGSPVTITIPTTPDGIYSVDEMVNFLNNEFVNNGMEIVAEKITSSNFEGIKITSTVKGLTSKVDVDSSSSAYNTLFKTRTYTTFSNNAKVESESKADSTGAIVGGKKIEGSNLPVKIEAGVNDSFSLEIKTSTNGVESTQTYTITLDEGDYDTSSKLLSHINDKLNGSSALAGYKDKIDVSYASGNKICLKGKAGSNITSVKVSGVTGNTGYEELFVGKTVTSETVKVTDKGTSTSPATITLNQSIPDPTTITADNNKLVINQNGANRVITLPTGDDVTNDKIVEEINRQAKEKVSVTVNRFGDSTGYGSTTSNQVKANGKGNTTVSPGNYSATGSSKEDQGNIGNFVYNNPATVTMSVKVPSTFKVDSSNNIFNITINDETRTIMLGEGTYSQSQLVNELQKKIDNIFGTKAGGAIVSISDSKLVFTARLNKNASEQIDGRNTNISFSNSGSSFIKSLHTSKESAIATSGNELKSAIAITDDNNSFVFQYDEGSGYNTINLVLSKGTYTRQGLINEINNQLNKAGVPVTAKLYNNKLQLVSDGVGSQYRINYDNFNGGTSAETLFGDFYSHKPAIVTAECKVLDSVDIGNDTKGFNITINGVNHSIELEPNTYTPSTLVDELNSKLNDKGVKVSLDNGKLKYETMSVGSTASVKVSYDTGGSSMIRIYGETTTVTTGITASFDSNNQLVLTGTQNGSGQSLEVSSDNGSIFQKAIEKTTTNKPEPTTGYVSNKHAFIDGVSILEPIKITEWNKELSFNYITNGVTSNINLSLDEKDYTYVEIVSALQDKINGIVPGELTVTADANGIRIETIGVGNKYKLSNFSGGMYYHVLCSSSKNSSNLQTESANGLQNVNSAFTVGRRDVKNESIEIENNINDVLTFDLKYGNTTKTFTVKLDAGNYIGNTLSDEIQRKLDIELQNQGFPAKMIEVGIGGVSTGVSGSNDSNALVLKMSKTVPLPAEGEYVIDGVRGSAAFSIFYQSDGKMVPAYAKGTKDISEGLSVTAENNELAFDVDGTNYSITLAEGEYTCEELINEINDKLNGSGAPIVAKLDDNNLRLSYTSYGEHIIDNFSGSAKSDLFFQENSAEGEKEVVHIQLSSRGGEENPDGSGKRIGQDGTVIDKVVLNTVSLGINSITISKPKYANKAIGRLAKANEMVSEIRSYYGAAQNRLESSIRGNDNTSENTQAAESRIRDVDMADEMVKNSKYSILQQASQAVLAQANSSAEGILTLLK